MGNNHRGRYKEFAETRRRTSPIIEIDGIKFNMQEIYESRELKKKLVAENPWLAEELYYRWRDSGEQEIGWFFAEEYNGHEEYGQSAYHIGIEVGFPGIKRPDSPSSESLRRLEDGFFM